MADDRRLETPPSGALRPVTSTPTAASQDGAGAAAAANAAPSTTLARPVLPASRNGLRDSRAGPAAAGAGDALQPAQRGADPSLRGAESEVWRAATVASRAPREDVATTAPSRSVSSTFASDSGGDLSTSTAPSRLQAAGSGQTLSTRTFSGPDADTFRAVGTLPSAGALGTVASGGSAGAAPWPGRRRRRLARAGGAMEHRSRARGTVRRCRATRAGVLAGTWKPGFAPQPRSARHHRAARPRRGARGPCSPA
jgi:hypothetical protein